VTSYSSPSGSEGVNFACPQCGGDARVTQVQGDRCPGCGFEFKWFGAGEAETARDYLAVLTGAKHHLALPEGQGFIVAHE
jgi:tRNA(Ile2) C34 agmatinyltransferase TiaS